MFGIETISTLSLIGLAAILIIETGLFVGVVLPGDSLLFSFGILAATNDKFLLLVIIVSAVSAYIGYEISYHFGKKYGEKLFSRNKGNLFSKENLERARRYFVRFGPITILFARFIPGVRAVAGGFAGATGMSKKKYIIYNAIGAIIWPLITVLLGYYFGQLIPNPDRFILPIVGVVVLIFVILPILLGYIKRYKYRKKIIQENNDLKQ